MKEPVERTATMSAWWTAKERPGVSDHMKDNMETPLQLRLSKVSHAVSKYLRILSINLILSLFNSFQFSGLTLPHCALSNWPHFLCLFVCLFQCAFHRTPWPGVGILRVLGLGMLMLFRYLVYFFTSLSSHSTFICDLISCSHLYCFPVYVIFMSLSFLLF